MKTIGFIGLGLMGSAMSKNIIDKFNGDVLVYDISTEAVAKLVACGATAAYSIAQIAQDADVIITMVPKSEHVEAVYLELLPHLHQGQITIDMSTIDPAVSQRLAKQVQATGASMLDAPVVKSVPAAINAELGIYVGGDSAAHEQVRSVLAMMGCNQIHLGDNGSGLVMKMLHNVLVAGIQNSVNEMLASAQAYGIAKPQFNEAISFGGGGNFYLSSKIKSLTEENYNAAFSLQNMAKDVNIMLGMMQEKNLRLPGVELVNQVYQQGLATGLGGEDFCATYKIVQSNSQAN
ncbi:NAD(P)-dependent oxidoreductase [Deefgea piscis]|uniref:NAD(P)-dependent oxidoreductase n=1 Tax=Deefgea piscis TaxID=2739061 RepID=UPI001C7E621E|nr:NAD(P)-dependent oxidoreductase [Deefgea piscis]QZA81726.1 NAD(P)-dependent oxidoreductase [Deefgea piscis]